MITMVDLSDLSCDHFVRLRLCLNAQKYKRATQMGYHCRFCLLRRCRLMKTTPHPLLEFAAVTTIALSSSDLERKRQYLIWGSFHVIWLVELSCTTDPLVHHGRHFGCTVHALCNVNSLLTNGLLREVELAESSDESFTAEYGFAAVSDDWLILVYLESEESIRYSPCCCRWYLAFRSVWWMAPKMKLFLLLIWYVRYPISGREINKY